eukprot:GHVR01060496.1.p1 GENE.GHVR01060496.1~~GHVR01060496.1.p1  ORF type:complete len:481 (+),score=165.66 GHVR01060496.1:456-1898(+)
MCCSELSSLVCGWCDIGRRMQVLFQPMVKLCFSLIISMDVELTHTQTHTHTHTHTDEFIKWKKTQMSMLEEGVRVGTHTPEQATTFLKKTDTELLRMHYLSRTEESGTASIYRLDTLTVHMMKFLDCCLSVYDETKTHTHTHTQTHTGEQRAYSCSNSSCTEFETETVARRKEKERWMDVRLKRVRALVGLFIEQSLPLPSTVAVQFIFFKAASLHPSYAEVFLQSLFRVLLDETNSSTQRGKAALCAASLVARCSKLPVSCSRVTLRTLLEVVLLLLDETHTHDVSPLLTPKKRIRENSQIEMSNRKHIKISCEGRMDTHPTEHYCFATTVCEAALYVLCYSAEGIEDVGGLEFLRNGKLSLMGFAERTPTVFRDVSQAVKIESAAACRSVGGLNAFAKYLEMLEGGDTGTIYPFDPCWLPRASECVSNEYRVWSTVAEARYAHVHSDTESTTSDEQTSEDSDTHTSTHTHTHTSTQTR